MDIIKIGTDSLKVTLEYEEALEYKLIEGNELGEREKKKLFCQILKEAKKKTGYAYEGGRIYADLFEGKDGKCEIFVSNFLGGDEMYKEKSISTEGKRVKSQLCIYAFDSLERLLASTARLKQMNYIGKSAVFYDELKGKYYITLEDVLAKDLKFAFLSEFSRQMKVSAYSYIKEHCKCICKRDAVKILSILN